MNDSFKMIGRPWGSAVC